MLPDNWNVFQYLYSGIEINFFTHQPIWLLNFYRYRPFITSTSQKKNLEAVYTGCDKATVSNHFVSVLQVCDIDKKKKLNIFWDFIDKDN